MKAWWLFRSDQIRSVAQLCPTLCDPMNRSTPGLPVHHQLLEFTQTHVHRVSDAIQPSHPLSSPSPLAPNPSQHQSFPISQLFAWGGQSTGVSIILSKEIPRLISFRMDWLDLLAVQIWQIFILFFRISSLRSSAYSWGDFDNLYIFLRVSPILSRFSNFTCICDCIGFLIANFAYLLFFPFFIFIQTC